MSRKADKARRPKKEKARRSRKKVSAKAGLRVNLRFNRRESDSNHYYYEQYGFDTVRPVEHQGWIKCRLLHGQGFSLIIPDQLYLEHGGLWWIQPLAFSPNVLANLSKDDIQCTLGIDISCGQRVVVQFTSADRVATLADGAELFKCRIKGPRGLQRYATGEAEWHAEGLPYLRLFHHTTKETVPLILDSSHFRTGAANIQGATKKLKNVAYAYFTPLNTIRFDTDLRKIAMSAGGTIELCRDGFDIPPVLMPGDINRYKDDIVQLEVYRCDPAKREASIDVWVDASVVAPQHVYRHDAGGPVYYELPHHFIHRVGAAPGQVIAFDAEQRIHRQDGLVGFDYIVVGDCRTLEGLIAPYDEEDTTHVMKVERIPEGMTMLDFWFERGNADLFSGKHVEMQEFEPPEAV